MQPNDAQDGPPRPQTRQEAQVAYLREQLGDLIEPGPFGWDDDDGPGIQYFVRRDHLVVSECNIGVVRDRLSASTLVATDTAADLPERSLAAGMRGVRLQPDSGALRTLAEIRTGTGDLSGLRDVVAGPEYLLHIAVAGGCCPADEPTPVAVGTPPDPPIAADPEAGRGIRVVVLDTGLDLEAVERHPWLHGVTGDPDPGIGDRSTPLNKYAGHGTFIAGIIRAVAPAAEVIVRAVFPSPGSTLAGRVDGAAFEGDIVTALEDCLLHDNPDVISLSAGTGTNRVEGPGLLNAFYETKLRHYKGIAVVAAAGNDGWRNRFWPAAAPWTVSVGALAANWRSRADFSNFGSWVDVYAPGQHLVNAFPAGTLTYREPPRTGNTATFTGLAQWSGTSFSTPVVAGLIAARMSRTGENGNTAAAALIAEAQRNAIRGVGAVLLPEV